jgi:hypothetical protein
MSNLQHPELCFCELSGEAVKDLVFRRRGPAVKRHARGLCTPLKVFGSTQAPEVVPVISTDLHREPVTCQSASD